MSKKLTVEQMSMAMSECAGAGLGAGGKGWPEDDSPFCLYQAAGHGDVSAPFLNEGLGRAARGEFYGCPWSAFDEYARARGYVVHDPDALLAWCDENNLVEP